MNELKWQENSRRMGVENGRTEESSAQSHLKTDGNWLFGNVEGISLEIDGVDDNSAWRGRPFFNYCNQMLCPAAVLFSRP